MKSLPTRKIKDIRGERFGRLVVIEFSHIAENKGRNAHWICQCDCGNSTVVSSGPLRKGHTISCGCYASEQSRKRIKELHETGKHLYFIKCGPFIKIGRADDINQRFRQLKAANPYPLEIVKTIEDGGHLEKAFHALYKDKHHSGEWYNLDSCEIVDIVR